MVNINFYIYFLNFKMNNTNKSNTMNYSKKTPISESHKQKISTGVKKSWIGRKSNTKECNHQFIGYCSYNNSNKGEHYDRFKCSNCGFIKTDPSDPLFKPSSESKTEDDDFQYIAHCRTCVCR